MSNALARLLTDPDGFFEERDRSPSLRRPALVVLVVGLLGGASSEPVALIVDGSLPPGTEAFFFVGVVFDAAAALLVPFLAWLLFAGAFQFLSRFYGGDGTFRTTVALVGWGFLPQVLGALLTAGAVFLVVGGVEPPNTMRQMGEFSGRLYARSALRATQVAGIGLTLWSGVIWTAAVGRARDLDRREAALVVAVPVLVSVALAVNGLL